MRTRTKTISEEAGQRACEDFSETAAENWVNRMIRENQFGGDEQKIRRMGARVQQNAYAAFERGYKQAMGQGQSVDQAISAGKRVAISSGATSSYKSLSARKGASTMARKTVRRKSDDDEEEKDLEEEEKDEESGVDIGADDDEEPPDIVEEEAPEEELEEPFVPKHSAGVIAKLHRHAKSEQDYLEKELGSMDNPVVAEALTAYKDEQVAPRMEHLEGMMEEHHPDHDMEKCLKSLDTDTGGSPQMPTGEENMVESGEVPDLAEAEEEMPEEVEEAAPMTDEWAEEEAEEEAHKDEEEDIDKDMDEDEEHKDDPATEEILERYQDAKGLWQSRSLGRASTSVLRALGHGVRKTSDGRLWLVRNGVRKAIRVTVFQDDDGAWGVKSADGRVLRLDPDNRGPADQMASKINGGDPQATREFNSEAEKSARRGVTKDGEFIEGTEHSEELDEGETPAPFNKGIPHPYVLATKDAADFLGVVATNKKVPDLLRGEAKVQAKMLRQVHKALTQSGKTQRDGGPGSELTDEGTAGNEGSMKDKGELEADQRAGTPHGEFIEGSGKPDVVDDGPDGSEGKAGQKRAPARRKDAGDRPVPATVSKSFNQMLRRLGNVTGMDIQRIIEEDN